MKSVYYVVQRLSREREMAFPRKLQVYMFRYDTTSGCKHHQVPSDKRIVEHEGDVKTN